MESKVAKARARRRPTTVRAEKVITKTTELKVDNQTQGEKSNETREQLQITTPDYGFLAYIEVKGGITRNLGNYESGRVDVGVSLPYFHDLSDSTAARKNFKAGYKLASELVDEMIAEELKTLGGE